MSLLNAEFSENFSTIDVGGLAGVEQDLSKGNKPINTPEMSFSTGFAYRHQLLDSGVDLVVNSTYQYIDERFTSFQNFESSRLDALKLMNFRIGLANDKFSVTAFVSNVFNDVKETNIATSALGALVNTNGGLDAPQNVISINRPRTIGIALALSY